MSNFNSSYVTESTSNAQQTAAMIQPSAGEQALESHEVIELQTFSERKAWIELKIELLERMPPIEVFVGLKALRASAEEIPGLPTRHDLEQWIAEHDAIEKETESFDRGELTKLRQLTKAATQRNLSPADTDVIELTLTTIYALDKLLHLLRDRSENLELLGIRLTWEENRMSAWIERRKLLEDLRNFIEMRVRWSPSCYDSFILQDESNDPHRRVSVTSLASNSSDHSVTSQAFSRSFRFKMGEILSRDAAQFAARVTSLRHGRIAAAGKALDLLIDHSRQPVPDVLLDEQDRLEEKGITQLEHIGKFIMSLVMQWRKADELYVETSKDKFSAQNLLAEIETANFHHPVQRQCTSFVSRADTLIKRIALRGNPSSPSSTFLSPEHPIFEDQHQCNVLLAESLSAEILSASQLAKKADDAAKAYTMRYEDVRHVEDLTAGSLNLCSKFSRMLTQLREGITPDNNDSLPVDLSTVSCLQPSRHSAFLALLPSVLCDVDQTVEQCNQVLHQSTMAIVKLDNYPGICITFKEDTNSEFQRLLSLRQEVFMTCENVKLGVDRLKEARRLWSLIVATAKHIEAVRRRVLSTVNLVRWKQISGQTQNLKQENMASDVPAHALEELNQIERQIVNNMGTSISDFLRILDQPLYGLFIDTIAELNNFLEGAVKLVHLLQSVQRQTSIMLMVYEEFALLQSRINDAIGMIKEKNDRIVTIGFKKETLAEDNVNDSVICLRQGVTDFTCQLPQRVLFIADYAQILHSSEVLPGFADKLGLSIEAPDDFTSPDDIVRHDANRIALYLNGELERLGQEVSHFTITNLGNEVGNLLQQANADIELASQELLDWKSQLSSVVSKGGELASFELLMKCVEDTGPAHGERISSSLLTVQDLLREVENVPGAHELHVTHCSAFDCLKNRHKSWKVDVSVLKDDILYQRKIEEVRLVQLSLEGNDSQEIAKARLYSDKIDGLMFKEEPVAFGEDRRLVGGTQTTKIESVPSVDSMERLLERVESGFADSPKNKFQATGSAEEFASTKRCKGDFHDLLLQITTLRKRLRLLGINEASRPTRSTQPLPHLEQLRKTTNGFQGVASYVSDLPMSADDVSVDVELQSLRSEVEVSIELLSRMEKLAKFSEDIRACDAVMSDLLDHIDSFPESPKAATSFFVPPQSLSPPEKLSARLSYVGHLVKKMATKSDEFLNDIRVTGEKSRIFQTWDELQEMAADRIGAKDSSSVIHANMYCCDASTTSYMDHARPSKINRSYSNLSVSSTSQMRSLAPPRQPSYARRVVSGSAASRDRARPENRPASQLSCFSSNRSVTGPAVLSIYQSTFSSRQRRASLSNSIAIPPTKRTPVLSSRYTAKSKRSSSPTSSETSTHRLIHTRSSTSMSTWARAPRNSLSSLVPNIVTVGATPKKKTSPLKNKYIANPQSKLDVAVGDVVNKLPVVIKVKGISETWKDKSGKYWIGNHDPKLCFCRILQSQTVMVRVGGGWSELSKFIRDHFSESFCLMTDFPSVPGAKEEKWISSVSLLEQPESSLTYSRASPLPPRTPEPTIPLPYVTLNTPMRNSPHSIKSTSPSVTGSPLTPMQFIRRADVDAILRPATPTKPAAPRTRNSTMHTNTTSRTAIWRP